jgi:phytanoyl-CoA hydroxylase
MRASAVDLAAALKDWPGTGYAVLPGFKSPQEVAALRARAEAIVRAFDPAEAAEGGGVFDASDSGHEQAASRDRWFLDSGDRVRCFFEEKAFDARGRLVVDKARAINKIGHAMHHLDPVFAAFSMGRDVAALAAALGVQRARVWQSMYIFKQPRIGGEVRWHQDASYLIAEPIPVTGLWFALEDATRDNGCLWMAPGGHRGPLREVFLRDGDRTALHRLDDTPWPDPGAGRGEAVPVEVEAGTVVAFHGLMPHYSAPNLSAASRHAYTLHFTDSRSRWSERNWLRTEVQSWL